MKRIFTETSTLIKSRYDSYTDAIENAYLNRSQMRQYSGYQAPEHEWTEIIKLARNGWPEGVTELKTVIDKLDISGQVVKPEIYYDVTGDAGIDIGRYLSGEPECMMYWAEPEEPELKETTEKAKFVRMLLNRASSAGSHQYTQRRNAAILALIDALETAGVSVMLDTVDACELSGKQCEIYIPVKRAGQELQLDQIAFAVSHQEYESKIAFALITQQGAIGKREAMRGNYGYPTDAEEAKDYDLYFGKMIYGENNVWSSEKLTKQWLKDTLNKFGIKVSS